MKDGFTFKIYINHVSLQLGIAYSELRYYNMCTVYVYNCVLRVTTDSDVC